MNNLYGRMMVHTIIVCLDNEEAALRLCSEVPAASNYDDVLAFRPLRLVKKRRLLFSVMDCSLIEFLLLYQGCNLRYTRPGGSHGRFRKFSNLEPFAPYLSNVIVDCFLRRRQRDSDGLGHSLVFREIPY